MNNIERIVIRLAGVACLMVGIVGFIRPFKTYDEDALYKVTTYNRRSGRTISEKIETGAELHTGQRSGALFMVGAGAFFIWLTKPKFNE